MKGSFLMAREARKELFGAPKIEDYFSEEEEFAVAAYRLPCGKDGDTIHYSEFVLVHTDFLDQEKFDRITVHMREEVLQVRSLLRKHVLKKCLCHCKKV